VRRVSSSVETAAPQCAVEDQRIAEGRQTNAAFGTCESLQFLEAPFDWCGDTTGNATLSAQWGARVTNAC
jgi:hypothetical protein